MDEFQDTDPEQWAILRTAFHGRPDESSALVLIGDPKQAIYAFRGADVVTYLQAVEDATDTATLSTSWRSDGPLLAGLHALLGETALGDPRIVVRPVDAAHPESRFSGGAPVRLRQVTRRAYRLGASSAPSAPDARGLLAKDVAADVASRLGTASGGGEHVVVQHPLQTVDERNFTPGALGVPGPFSHDDAAFAGARQARQKREPVGALVGAPLSLPTGAAVGREAGATATGGRPDVELDDLVRLLENAPRWFAQHTLDVGLVLEEEDVEDRLPLSLTGLAGWGVGDRVLRAALAGVDPNRAMQAEWRRGQVPPRELGRSALQEVVRAVGPLRVAAVEAAREADVAAGRPVSQDVLSSAETVDVRATLPDGGTVVGSVPGVHGARVVRTEYSRLGPKHRLRAWVQALALRVSDPDRPWDAVAIGRSPRGPGVAWSTLTPPDRDTAAAVLADLVALRDEAAREPLPLLPEVALRYAEERRTTDARDALMRAGWAWNKGFERKDPYVVLAWGQDPALPDLAGHATTADLGRFPDDPTRLGALARRVWDPLLEHELTRCAMSGPTSAPATPAGRPDRRCPDPSRGARGASTRSATCRAGRSCSRRAPARARRTPSRPSRRATSPRAWRRCPRSCS
ncbi:hypothetical protein IU11_08615 [Cellulosimicrobium sp. MM]|nr:hypothetical protein IU11_08615 [Cellulosimicrobium sp. MM]